MLDVATPAAAAAIGVSGVTLLNWVRQGRVRPSLINHRGWPRWEVDDLRLQIAGALWRHRSEHVRTALAALPTAECVLWTGQVDRQGYGMIDSEITPLAHRYVFILVKGMPELPELDHLCRITLCVNPDHLEPVTGAENRRRADAARLSCRSGHEYTPENVYLYRGVRYCRECRRIQDRKRGSGGARAAAARAA